MIFTPTRAPGFSAPVDVPVRVPKNASDKPLILPFEIMYDHRERAGGWRFVGLRGDSRDRYRPLSIETFEIYMKTADYLVEVPGAGSPGCFIERKSHADVIGSLGGGHERLRREHERMQELTARGAWCFVLVESDLSRVVADLDGAVSKLSSNAVYGVLSSWPQKFNVFWHFCGSRHAAEMMAVRIFRNWFSVFCSEKEQGR